MLFEIPHSELIAIALGVMSARWYFALFFAAIATTLNNSIILQAWLTSPLEMLIYIKYPLLSACWLMAAWAVGYGVRMASLRIMRKST